MRFMIMRKTDRNTADDVRVTFCNGKPEVTHGPFAETGQLMAGYTMIDVNSLEEAVQWVRRRTAAGNEAEVEIRELGCLAGLVGVSPPAQTPVSDPRFFVLFKANQATESGVMPDDARLAAMAARNQEAVQAGVLLAGDGLQPSWKGARVKFSGGKTTVIDGPFTEAKELIAGFWLIQVKSKQEAIEWVARYPFPLPDLEVDIRRVADGEINGQA
jgi:hypothetical protein